MTSPNINISANGTSRTRVLTQRYHYAHKKLGNDYSNCFWMSIFFWFLRLHITYLRSFVSGDCVCTASGDPHYHRHDGGRIDYQGPCTYRLINASLESGDCGMIVNAKNRPHPNNNKVSLTKWIDVQMIPSVDTIRLGQGGEVFVSLNFGVLKSPSLMHWLG